jgi:hypothetical protein
MPGATQPNAVELGASPFYPLNLNGPLCPMLRDPATLRAAYITGTPRREIKHFIKTHRNKFNVDAVISTEIIVDAVTRTYDDPTARAMFRRKSDAACLHQALWQWVKRESPQLTKDISSACEDRAGKLFLKPSALDSLLHEWPEARKTSEELDKLAFLVLAFAMLQEEDRCDLIGSFLAHHPLYAERMGAPVSASSAAEAAMGKTPAGNHDPVGMSALEEVRNAWAKLPEVIRRDILHKVQKKAPDCFARLAANFNGFSPQGVANRPPALVARIDKHLFGISDGRYAQAFFDKYVFDCNPPIAAAFLQELAEVATCANDRSAREDSARVLSRLAGGYDPALFSFFQAVMRLAAPRLFAETPLPPLTADDMAVTGQGERIAGTDGAADGCEEPGKVGGAMNVPSDTLAAGGRATEASAARDEKAAVGKATTLIHNPAPDGQAQAARPRPPSSATLLEKQLGTLESEPAQETLRAWDTVEKRVADIRPKVLALRKKLDVAREKLSTLKAAGLLDRSFDVEDILRKQLERPLAAASTDLEREAGTADAVEKMYGQWQELRSRLGCPATVWAGPQATALEGALARVSDAVAREESKLRERSRCLASASDLIERLIAGDTTTAVSVIRESEHCAWRDLLRCVVQHIRENGLGRGEIPDQLQRFLALVGRNGMTLGLLFSLCMEKCRDAALASLIELSSNGNENGSPADGITIGKALALLTPSQLAELSRVSPGLAGPISRFLLLSSLRDGRLKDVRWLNSVAHCDGIDVISQQFYAQCIGAEDGRLLDYLVDVAGPGRNDVSDRAASVDALRRVHHVYEQHGWSGNYFRLRELLKSRCLSTVMYCIQNGNVEQALATLARLGDWHAVIIPLARELKNVSDEHVLKVRRYAEQFEDAVRSWAVTVGRPPVTPRQFRLAFESLRRASQESREGSAAALYSGLCAIAGRQTDVGALPPSGFGQCARTDGRVLRSAFRPEMIESWINAEHDGGEEAAVAVVFAEHLGLELKDVPPPEPGGLVAELFRRSEYAAAAHLVQRVPEMRKELDKELEAARGRTLAGYEEIWAEASALAETSADTKQWTDEVESLLGELRFEDARSLLPELEGVLKAVKVQSSPAFLAARALLVEAGQEVAIGDTLAELERRVVDLRDRSAERRGHLRTLLAAASNTQLPERFCTRLRGLAEELDRPSLWPDPACHDDLRQYLSAVIDFVIQRTRWQQTRPEVFGTICEAVAAFLGTCLPKVVKVASPRNWGGLDELALGISADGWEADEVVAFIREQCAVDVVPPVVARQGQDAEDSEVTPGGSAPRALIDAPKPTLPQEALPGVIESIRTALRPGMVAAASSAEEVSVNKEMQLRNYFRAELWESACSLAARLGLDEETDPGWLSPSEMAYCAAIGLTGAPGDSDEVPSVCLAAILGIVCALVLNDRVDAYYYASPLAYETALRRCLYRGLMPHQQIPQDDAGLQAALSALLSEIADLKPSTPRCRWLASAFERTRALRKQGATSNGSGVLGCQLWNVFTGMKDPAEPRHRLLQFAYRLELIDDVLDALAREYAAPLDHYVLRFLKATRLADANPSAAEEAIRLAHVVNQHATATASMRPWRLLVSSLSPLRGNATAQVPCELLLEDMVAERDRLVLQVCARPAPGVLVERLHLVVGAEGSASSIAPVVIELLEKEGAIAGERVFEIEVPLRDGTQLPDLVEVPFELTVESAQNEPRKRRDRWSRELKLAKTAPLSRELVERCWPGATGDPVYTATQAYHGRTKERKVLRSLLEGRGGRQGSAVIIGQRRIGKTSLLIDTLLQYPPSEGHVCGVFCYFGGIQKKRPHESLSETVFHALTDWAGDPGGYNRDICAILQNSLGSDWLPKLRRDLNPATSIASALGTFVDRVSEHTDGRVKRVAFFSDEFQSVFRFPADEVDGVMWALRPIVQLSPSISLVFAGSGLTRNLVRGYDKAFFGSIETITLEPFSIESDYDAIRDTFLPTAVRECLCPDASMERRLVSHACELCGGHPWFLSMLGYNAAKALGGRPLTPVLLSKVCREMIAGHGDSVGRSGGADRFYGHLFDSLDVVASQKPIAELVLANIARQVTIEWPWLTAEQAISGPQLDAHAIPSGRRLDALRLLRDEDVLLHKQESRSAPRYRIRIPLIAEALQCDADEIEYKAGEALKPPEVCPP